MKLIPLLLLFFVSCCLSCRNEQDTRQLLNKAETLLVNNPDSAFILLENISDPESLSNKLFAKWSMLSGKVANKLHEEMPYVNQLLRAQSWYDRNGSAEEQARIGFFLGRSYVEDKELGKAMEAYVSALLIADQGEEYNVAGYICSYMGDLYEFDDKPQKALEKYSEGAICFSKAKNERSYALALRDIGRMWFYQDSCSRALEYMKKADSIVTSLNDSKAMASTTNGLGNIYSMLGDYDTAETFLLKSLEMEGKDKVPSYLALSDIFVNSGDLKKARFYLEKAQIKTKDETTPIGIIYQLYLIEKADNNLEQALHYLEQYEAAADSVSTLQNEASVMKIEKKYRNEKLLNENARLRVIQQQYFILFIIALFVCLGIFVVYQIKLRIQQAKIYEQQRLLDKNKINLIELSAKLKEKEKTLSDIDNYDKHLSERNVLQQELETYNKQKQELERINTEIIQQRREKLLSSAIAKKMRLLSKTVKPGAVHSLLTTRDWNSIRKQINETYLSLIDFLNKETLNLSPGDLECCYLTLFQLELKEEAILLNINPNSASKRRTRLREKLGIIGEETSLYDYLTNI